MSLAEIDRRVLHWVTCELYSPALDAVLVNAQEKRIAIPLALGLLAALAASRPRLALRTLLAAALGFGLAMFVATILWSTLGRPRPPAVYEHHLTTPAERAACRAHPDALALRKSISTSPSFPSRHALTAGVFAAVFLLASRPLGALVLLYALLVIVGRVYGGKHWPSDVLAGFGLGLVLGWAAWRLVGRFGAAYGLDPSKPSGPPGSSSRGQTSS